MIDGFKRPPQRPTPPPQRPIQPRQPGAVQQTPMPPATPVEAAKAPTPQITPTPTPQPQPAVSSLSVKKRRKWPFIVGGIVLFMVIVVTAAIVWYLHALTPVNAKDKTMQQVQIGESASLGYVAGRLEERQLIRSGLALQIHAYLHHQAQGLKQGTCNLSASESAADILAKLTKGCNDFKVVTFYPGGTVEPVKNSTSSKDFSVYASLKAAGYSDADITAALSKTYEGELFAGKPANTSLEGYIYGDTYYVNADAGAEEALHYAFTEMEKVITDNDLVAKFKKQGLSLYQGITLASIIQRELSCDNLSDTQQAACYANQQKIAQVFYSRLSKGMTLGSDVTFIYAAGLTGEVASPSLESPYNTRIHEGLPPGPIASPSEFALKAAANPASTNYLYFVAGDEGGGAVYFATTEEGHQKNIKEHCQIFCN